ncbi:MAG: branched-chain amino acid ABC transporter permease [Acidimicrobiia bacterium]
MEAAVDVVISGLILGGLYALIAVGLSLQYGVGRVLNVSHGEFIILAALLTYTLYSVTGLHPLVAIALVAPALFVVGFALDRTLFNDLRRTSIDDDHFEGRSLLVSFGLLFVIQNVMLMSWGAELRGYSILNTPVQIFGNRYGLNRVLALVVAVITSVAFFLFIRHTRLGKAIRAAAERPDMAEALGVNRKRVLAICFGLGAGLAGLAGVLYSMMFDIQASRGIELTVVAIVVVVVGGLGSITGSMIGGFLLGLVIALVNFLDPSLSLVAFYFIFIVVLLVKPSGLLGRQIHAD